MDKIEEFEKDLRKRGTGSCARWHAIDLHNHTPASFDYAGDKATALEESAKRIRETDLSVVMFTDHGVLPSAEFIQNLADQTGRLILRGVELNVFVDAWEKPKNKVTKNLFFHLLIGFNPDGEESPEYWLQHIYKNCDAEERDTGSHTVKGISSLQKLADALADSGAIIVPAHLHSSNDAFRSRSIDDIYADREFLKFAKNSCTALEVSNDKTAAFFDGQHEETENLHISCIRSSDSHEPSTLGSRTSWVQMEQPTFGELKAALELPFRFSRSRPTEPDASIIGINIKGEYFTDFWVEFSPHCNVLMGVKGSGKTAVLECLRYALGADIPEARRQQVREHLEFILGPAGSVQVLVKRHDGSKLLIYRSISSSDFEVWFSGDRKETFRNFDAIDFPSHILGWHEIERAAEDANIRRIYMDTIAGSSRIKTIERDAKRLADKVREKHAIAASRYSVFRDLNDRAVALEERRKGLQELDDADLIHLHQEYEAAIQNAEVVRNLPRLLEKTTDNWSDRWKALWTELQEEPFVKQTKLADAIQAIESELGRVFETSNDSSKHLQQAVINSQSAIGESKEKFETDFTAFKSEYDQAVSILAPDKRKLLKSHQSVAEETAGLTALQRERDVARSEVETLLSELTDLCTQICEKLDERTRVRSEAISLFSKGLDKTGVSLAVESMKPGASLQQLRATYREGAQIIDTILISTKDTSTRHHASIGAKYEELRRDLVDGNSIFFSHPEFAFYLTYFEDDDLHITLEVGPGVEKSIDQLSAGQRCTAIFPLLLKLQSMPLVVDQPEDNLDNRHIASIIAPEILSDKRSRQMIFTSHNANLVVLSDAEMIISFEGDGSNGWIENAGFLATRDSVITNDVLEVLDGGRQALELRYKKYGKFGT